MINCTQEQFLTLYLERNDLWKLLSTKPKNSKDLVTNYLPSKLWRLNNIYSIINKQGESISFSMNYAQLVVYSKSLIHPRVIILKSRQQGISTLWLISFFDDVMFLSNYEAGLMAQGKDEAGTLLTRVKHAWEKLDVDIKYFLGRSQIKSNSSEVKFNNNSTMFIRTSFRSATLQRLHISELGKIANKYPERAKETKTGTLQALAVGNTGVIESTAEGNNMFQHMWTGAVEQHALGKLAGKDFYPVFLSWLDDPDCVEEVLQIPDEEEALYLNRLEKTVNRTLTVEQRNFWIAQHRELEGSIYQEYPSTPEEAFTAAQDGTYWAKRYVSRVLQRKHKKPAAELYDPNLDLYCCLDAGRSDYMVLVLFQLWKGQIRLIYETYNTGEWLGFYVDAITETCKQEGWTIKHWYLPHDMEVTDLTEPEAKTREQVLNELGIRNTTVLKKMSKGPSREQVRQEFDNIWLANECTYIEQCCLHYSKEWNPLLEVWRDDNKRDKWAHGADTLRYIVQACHKHLSYDSSSAYEDAKSGDNIAI